MPTTIQVEEWIEQYRRAWESADTENIGTLFTDDARYRDNIFEEPHAGRSGIKEYWTNVTAAQSEVTVRMGSPVVDGQRVNVEFWTTMLVAGDPVTLPGCLILDFTEDGVCSNLREYWHFQPGHFSPPAGWGQ